MSSQKNEHVTLKHPLSAWRLKIRSSMPWHLSSSDAQRAVCGARGKLEDINHMDVTCLSEIGCEACRAIATRRYRELRRQFLARAIEAQKNIILDTVLGHVFPTGDENQEVSGADLLENLTVALDAFSPGVLLCGRDVRADLGACHAGE